MDQQSGNRSRATRSFAATRRAALGGAVAATVAALGKVGGGGYLTAEAKKKPKPPSPNGLLAVVEHGLTDGHTDTWSHLFTVMPKGKQLKQLTSGDEDVWDPRWSPDGTKILVRRHVGDTDLWRFDADGGNPTNLTNSTDDGYSGTWSPDGTKIAFCRGKGSSTATELWIMDADGSHKSALGVDGGNPDWSANGSPIVYQWFATTAAMQLWSVKPDGSDKKQLTTDETVDHNWPRVSPDGSMIAFSSLDGIWVVGIDGSAAKRLTTAPTGSRDTNPAWAPTGTQILFVRNRTLQTVSSNGGKVKSLPVKGGPYYVDWQTNPAAATPRNSGDRRRVSNLETHGVRSGHRQS